MRAQQSPRARLVCRWDIRLQGRRRSRYCVQDCVLFAHIPDGILRLIFGRKAHMSQDDSSWTHSGEYVFFDVGGRFGEGDNYLQKVWYYLHFLVKK